MKILIFSDIHTDWKRLDQLLDIEADAYFCAGDVVSWARGLPDAGRLLARRAERMYVLPGNHESTDDIARLCAEFGLHNFHGQSITLDGVTIAGLGYSSPTPFKTPGEYTEAQMAAELAKLPPAQVLICHAPPKNTPLDRAGEKQHFGSTAVAEYIAQTNPAYFFCGHIHEAEGVEQRIGGTLGVNVGKKGYLLDLGDLARS
jgi:Icc-related predicted phosphoesterase